MMKLLLLSGTKRYVVAWLTWSLLAVLFAASNISYAGVNTTTPVSQLTSDSSQAVQIRTLVASALATVAQIRAHVRHGKTEHLRDYLNQLNTLVTLIKAARPTGEIDALVIYYKQHLDFEDNKQVLADILPLYTALDALPNSKQTQTARQQLNSVRASLQNGKRADALQSLEDMQRTLSIDGVDFPLQAAEEKLRTITSRYEQDNVLQQSPELLGLETDFLQILNSL